MPKLPNLSSLRSILLVASLVVCGPATAHGSAKDVLDFHQAPPNTMAWGWLAKVGIQREDGKFTPQFLPPLLAMEGKPVVLYGYMTAKPGQKLQQRFLLSPRPIFCADCDPLGPQEIVEVVLDRPTPATTLALAVRGRLALLKRAPDGLLYRLESASVVPTQPSHSHRNKSTKETRNEAR